MTEIAGQAKLNTPPAPVIRRSWLGEVLYNTFGRRGAQIGLAWILLIAALSVFSPFLANSHPLLLKMNGQWSSPLLRNLNVVDVSLLGISAVAVGLWFMRSWPVGRRWLIALIALAIIIPASFWATSGRPQKVWLGQYAEWENAGEVEYVLRTPIRYSPTELLPFNPAAPHPLPPVPGHMLGTERNGNDILSVMIHASRIAMFVGFISTGIALVIGIVIGGLMGYFSGWVDLVGMRLVEIFGAIPQLYLLLTFVAFFPTSEYRIYFIMVIIGLTSWQGDARFVRAEFLRLRGQDFVQAARAAGLPLWSILFRHLLPNALAPLLVSVSFGVASAILAEATLSFLGLGLVGAPSWGQLLNQATSRGSGVYWWLATFPGIAIFMTVFAYNLIGEALRDALDPRMRR